VNLDKLVKALTSVLSNVSKDNLVTTVVEGTTSGTADTSAKFRHNIGGVPSFWFPLEGDVYVPFNGIGPSEIDVRSTKTSEQFRLLVVR
jgi:hypothetical protein